VIAEHHERKYRESEAHKNMACLDYYKTQVRFRNILSEQSKMGPFTLNFDQAIQVLAAIFGCVLGIA
jgi:hypothetical protein